jgi:pseudouridine-5'-monophosphatase
VLCCDRLELINSLKLVVWIPDPNLVKLGTVVAEVPDQVIQSMEDFKPEEWGLPPYDQ